MTNPPRTFPKLGFILLVCGCFILCAAYACTYNAKKTEVKSGYGSPTTPLKHTAKKTTNTARLTAKCVVGAGDNITTYELRVGEKVTAARVHRSYNVPTGQGSIDGSLASIYDQLTGAPPEKPSDYQDLDSIIPVFKKSGWEITGHTRENGEWGGDSKAQITTITFHRKNAG